MFSKVTKATQKVLKEKESTKSETNELPVILKRELGTKAYALREPATALPGICLDTDLFDPALVSTAGEKDNVAVVHGETGTATLQTGDDGTVHGGVTAAGGGLMGMKSGVGAGGIGMSMGNLVLNDGSGKDGTGKPLTYGRYDMGRKDAADQVLQLTHFNKKHKVGV